MVRIRGMALLALLALLAVACGQRPGVYQAVSGSGSGGLGGDEVALADDGTLLDDGTLVGEDGAPIDPTGGGGGGSTGGGGDGGGGDDGGPTAKKDDGPEWGKEIRIGIHAPVTGAASLKASAFDAGRELYWKHLEEKGVKIHGRTVKVVFKDDQYRPSTAALLCKQMVQGDNAFMLIGAAGTDQIVECARFASSQGVPYLSAGVTENVVQGLPNYFALSMSYRAQGPLLAKHLKTLAQQDACRSGGLNCDDTMRVGLIVSDTPNFDDAASGFREGFKKEFGRDVDYFKVVAKEPSQQEAAQQAAALRQWNNARGIDVVYILSSVTFTVNLANSLDDGYRPRFVGTGITMVNQGVDLSCPKGAFDGARYYNPYPAWANRNDFDPEFDAAVAEQGKQGDNVANGGDLMWTLWTLSRVIHKALDDAGPNLTRGGFIRSMEKFKYAERKGFVDLQYAPDDHFGASTAHLLEARCQVQGDSRGQFFQLKNAWS